MSGDVIPQQQAFTAARANFDRALARITRDRAAGRLSPAHEQIVSRAIARRAERDRLTDHAAA